MSTLNIDGDKSANPIDSARSHRSEQSFRIRKFSRNLSRHSHLSSHQDLNGEDDKEEEDGPMSAGVESRAILRTV